MTAAPLVSIIIPCYQTEKYIREAIDSVAAQTYNNLEILAIDDGSTDQTLSILKEYAGLVTVLQHPSGINKGVSLTRKLGIDNAKGKYIAFLDADDCFEPEKIAAQVEVIEQNREVILCHTAIRLICDQNTSPDFENHFNYCDSISKYDLKKSSIYLTSNRICNSSVMIRANILKKIPYYGKQIFQCEDWLMWTLAAEYGEYIFLPDKYTRYRFHPDSATNAVVNNKIKETYSRIEFYMSIMSKSISEGINKKCSYFLIKNLEALCSQYGTSSKNSCESFKKKRSIRKPFIISSVKYYFYNSYIANKIIKPLIRIVLR